MKYIKLKVLLPFVTMGIMAISGISYADVKVNINNDKTEAYSYNSDETVNVDVPNNENTPLSSEVENNYKSNVDSDDEEKGYNSNIDEDYSNSNVDTEYDSNNYNVIDIEEDQVPTVDSYEDDSSSEKGMKEHIMYADEYYSEQLIKNGQYEILSKDMVVQKNVAIDEKSKIRYTTLPESSTVELIGFTTQNGKKLVEIMADNKKVYYEDIENFYNNSIKSDATPFQRYIKNLINDASMRGTEKGYNTCVAMAILFMLGTIFLVKFLDNNVLRFKDYDNPTQPYINSIARVMPGAMIGSFIIIANMFDENAVDYYFYEGFSFLGKNYELIHWLLQIMIILTIVMVWRLILEGIKCFTFPCMIIRTIIILAANIASLYLCYGLSYVGIAIYVLLILYQCICVNSYGCPDISEESSDEEADEGECDTEDNNDEGDSASEPEPEAL